MLVKQLEPELLSYSSNCVIAHFVEGTYRQDVLRSCDSFIVSSYFRSLEANIRPRGLSLKYVAEGLETYQFMKKTYQVSAGKYILANDWVDAGEVCIQNADTWSMCVDIDMCLIQDILQQLNRPNDLDTYTDLSRYYLTPELFLRETLAGDALKSFLNSMISSLATGNSPLSSEELLYDLTAMLVQENLPLIGSYYQLQTAKTETRKELFARLLKGKEVMDDHVFQTIEMKQVAQACCLSEFRFYRLFKQAFGISPYQYLLNKRIEKSLELKKLNLNWTEIALLLNFSDLAAFSNAFKKIKGVFPNNFSLQ